MKLVLTMPTRRRAEPMQVNVRAAPLDVLQTDVFAALIVTLPSREPKE